MLIWLKNQGKVRYRTFQLRCRARVAELEQEPEPDVGEIVAGIGDAAARNAQVIAAETERIIAREVPADVREERARLQSWDAELRAAIAHHEARHAELTETLQARDVELASLRDLTAQRVRQLDAGTKAAVEAKE